MQKMTSTEKNTHKYLIGKTADSEERMVKSKLGVEGRGKPQADLLGQLSRIISLCYILKSSTSEPWHIQKPPCSLISQTTAALYSSVVLYINRSFISRMFKIQGRLQTSTSYMTLLRAIKA